MYRFAQHIGKCLEERFGISGMSVYGLYHLIYGNLHLHDQRCLSDDLRGRRTDDMYTQYFTIPIISDHLHKSIGFT
ncbi:hypothetical protein SDC9_208320 [bioreactor metagenome]|uniref:Uncharacterized protein n=1 Tax=bioreactor metagenome TaxID=1076179 RepID=A0A645JAF5_9ZZZZ